MIEVCKNKRNEFKEFECHKNPFSWEALFEKDKQFWLKELKDLETSASEYIRSLIDHNEFNSFLNGFMKEVYPHRMFLQSHSNAYSHRYV